MKIRYFDYAATTPVRHEVAREMLPYFGEEFGNPSSLYSLGRHNKRAIEEARQKVANAINAKRKEIYFTSCGSESDNLAIKGIAKANRSKGNHIITTKIEHPAVLNTCKSLEKEGYEVTYLNVDSNGIISLAELNNKIKENTVLISVMFANNEIGTIQPIKEIGEIAKSKNIIFHTDAVQAVGNLKIDVEKLGVDAMSMSGHKIYAPKGVGALYVRDGVKFECLQHGGHQEHGFRAGTENVAGIVAMGKAIELVTAELESNIYKLTTLRNYYINQIESKIENIHLNGDRISRLPGNCNISFSDVDASELILALDSYGICASAGSACTSGTTKPSHVLVALGLKENFIKGALRTTFGKENTKEDIDFLVHCIQSCVRKQRAKF